MSRQGEVVLQVLLSLAIFTPPNLPGGNPISPKSHGLAGPLDGGLTHYCFHAVRRPRCSYVRSSAGSSVAFLDELTHKSEDPENVAPRGRRRHGGKFYLLGSCATCSRSQGTSLSKLN